MRHLVFSFMFTMIVVTTNAHDALINQSNMVGDNVHEVPIDDTIKIFVQHTYKKFAGNDNTYDENVRKALYNCYQNIQNNAHSILLEDLVFIYPLLLSSYEELLNQSLNHELLKAPREENRPLIVGPGGGSCDISSVKNLLNTVLINLNQCCQQIENNFITTFSILNDVTLTVSLSFVNTLTTLIEDITVCFATSLTSPQTLSQSGYYCLANDVNGSFVIAANNVTLDLNSHTISSGGVNVQEGIVDSTIRNGTITNSIVGIELNNTTHATVENVSITESPGLTAITATGEGNIFKNIYIDTVAIGFSGDGNNPIINLLMDGVTIANTTGTGIVFNGNGFAGGFLDSIVKNVTVTNCGSNGIVCPTAGGTLNCLFSDINITQCTQYGFFIAGSINQGNYGCNLTNVSVIDMQPNATAGIFLINPISCKLTSCVVQNCYGPTFSFFGTYFGYGNVFDSCISSSLPGSGFAQYGFQIESRESVIKNCQVLGLQQGSGSLSAFYSNGAFNEFTNCTASDIECPFASSLTTVIGFDLNLSSTNNILTDCKVLGIQNSEGPLIAYYSNAYNNQFTNCTALGVLNSQSVINIGAVGFQLDTAATDNILIDCLARDVQMTQITANLVRGFLIQGFNASLYNCIADQCGNAHIDQSWGFFINDGADNVLLINCSATNSDGYGFESVANNSAFIGCTAMSNSSGGFFVNGGAQFVFRDCTAMFNPGGGFINLASPSAISAINCYAAKNSGGDFNLGFGFPNVQAAGTAAPVTGVNISG